MRADDWVCPKCGEHIEAVFDACWKCNTRKDGKPADKAGRSLEKTDDKARESRYLEAKYPALRVIAGLYKLFAWLFAVIAIIGIFIGLKNMGEYGSSYGTTVFLISLMGGAVAFITFLAASETIKVFIDIEENTRKAVLPNLKKM